VCESLGGVMGVACCEVIIYHTKNPYYSPPQRYRAYNHPSCETALHPTKPDGGVVTCGTMKITNNAHKMDPSFCGCENVW